MIKKLRSCGPFALPLAYLLFGLFVFALFRVALVAVYHERFATTPEYPWLFLVGIRMDLILLCYFLLLPTALLFALPARAVRAPLARSFIAGWCALTIAVIVYMEVATFPFMAEFDLRPDIKFLEYLKHVQEVATTLLKVYALELSIGTVALVVCAVLAWKGARRILASADEWSWGKRLIALPFVMALLAMGARSTLGHRPANLSTACFSENHLANELALNSTYTMLYAGYSLLRNEKNPSLNYGKMEKQEVLERVKNKLVNPGPAVAGDIPFLHRQESPFALKRPMNVVIFLQESMGAVDVGCLKGPPITPNLCRLKDEGLWFSNMYATGTRTVRGIEATVSGFLPTSTVGVLKLPRARKNFFTAGALFKSMGYETEFFYGGMANFDEMKTFFLGNGFETIYDEPTYKNPAFLGTWGVSDEDLVRKANEEFVRHGDKPFFALMLSTSNHSPYEFPDGRIDLYEQPKQTHLNAIKYADYAIGLFFELAKKEAYFKDTLFLVVADHNSHVSGNEHVPMSKFHIPALLIGPNVPAKTIDTLASQIDLLPTILHFTGLHTVHPMIGRDLMAIPEGTPGRAFLQYASNNAYWVGDDVIIQRPYLEPEQYTYDTKTEKLTPKSLDPEMARDALAHAHLPWILYSGEDYKLPDSTVVTADQADAVKKGS
ncbi:MAG: LTA synthase family protein [Deltaproteobacteria bacterium]|nr:LTA synthase family protein [Deltaproteobacteria bacterium]